MENRENTLKKVYIVWYDNQLPYEDHHIYLSRAFTKEEDAKVYAEQENERIKNFLPSMTKEEYYAQDAEDIQNSYEEFCEYEAHHWEFYCSGKYYYTAQDVCESL